MLLLTHILIALTSIVFATYMVIAPSQAKVRISYALAGLTLSSGTILVFTTGSALLQACATGLVYFATILVLTKITQARLQKTSN